MKYFPVTPLHTLRRQGTDFSASFVVVFGSETEEMKNLKSHEILTAPLFVKISTVVFISFGFFYLCRHWSESSGFQRLVFFNSRQSPPSISFSGNSNITLNRISSIIPNQTDTVSFPSENFPPSYPPQEAPPPPPKERFGIVDENGIMRDDFEIGEFDPDAIDSWEDGNGNVEIKAEDENSVVRVTRYRLCPESMRDYIPCLDNVEEIRKLRLMDKGERYERHCPAKGKGLDCLVPAPKNYKKPIPWPSSRDEVWYSNVPHPDLVEDKGGQNWISIDKDKLKFPGSGTQFVHGADQYLDQISQILHSHHTRVVLDVGCGVASFGAFLLSRDVIPLSIAPKDVHKKSQIQFALERGVPAMVAAFATRRLLYPSQAFDLIHCSQCQVNWTQDDGILLLEVNRMLRAGGYFAWAAQPVYKHEESQQQAWKEEMEDLTARICWELVKKEGYVAIWRKPLNNSCYLNRDAGVRPPLCETNNDPDNVWYVSLRACITRLPENGYGANVLKWPARLHYPPDRLQTVKMDASISKTELFETESKYWNDIIGGYVRVYRWKKFKLRNVMDMKAGFGGFAAALVDQHINAWVMNVVPITGPNTLPVIYDRGLIGVMHDWCEPFDTYPRTYDLLHASGLFSVEQKRCNISSIILEMDRMLRPGGRAYIRDTKSIIQILKQIASTMGWRAAVHDTSEGPHAIRKVLICDKK